MKKVNFHQERYEIDLLSRRNLRRHSKKILQGAQVAFSIWNVTEEANWQLKLTLCFQGKYLRDYTVIRKLASSNYGICLAWRAKSMRIAVIFNCHILWNRKDLRNRRELELCPVPSCFYADHAKEFWTIVFFVLQFIFVFNFFNSQWKQIFIGDFEQQYHLGYFWIYLIPTPFERLYQFRGHYKM